MSALHYSSSRGNSPELTVSDAIRQGLAPDGGLYLPTRLPAVDRAALGKSGQLAGIAAAALGGFFEGDRLQPRLAEIAAAAFNFPAPTTPIVAREDRAKDPASTVSKDGLFVLELFHGPTAAFKDFGARFLAQTLERTRSDAEPPMTILVATSGDTGGAVAAAFHRRPWVRIVILYPKGLVSARQEQQLTCWGDNVRALRIAGTFDDCQRLVKEAFVDSKLQSRHRFSSANSINVGRLLPQMAYYVASSFEVERRTGEKASYIIPAGNLGNAFAAMWARAIGCPVARIVLAHNANRAVPDFLRDGRWRPRASIPTLASAMDVGNPSNMERVRALYPSFESVVQHLSADSVDDATIRRRIGEDFMHFGREWCPHTATAAEVYHRLSERERRESPWVLVATAHPAKFNDIVEPIIGKPVEVPPALARLLQLPQQVTDLPPTLTALAAALE